MTSLEGMMAKGVVCHRQPHASATAIPDCVRLEDVLDPAERTAIHCNDGDPCTQNACLNTTTGQCANPSWIGTQQRPPLIVTAQFGPFSQDIPLDPGCGAVVNAGCGAEHCDASLPRGSQCTVTVTAAALANDLRTPECGGDGSPHSGLSPRPEDRCLTDRCTRAGTCQRNITHDELCGDGVWCTTNRCSAPGGFGTCTPIVDDGMCAIDGECYDDEEDNPNTPCEYCDASENPRQWTHRGPDC